MKKLFRAIGMAALMLVAGTNVYVANQTPNKESELNLGNVEALAQLPEYDYYDSYFNWSFGESFLDLFGLMDTQWYEFYVLYEESTHTCTHYEICDKAKTKNDGCNKLAHRQWSITVG